MRVRAACLGTVMAVLAWLPASAAPAIVAGAPEQAAEERVQVQPIDVNRATAAELQTVPGIGPATAQRIIEWRDKNGPFERLEDLLNVRGIGEKTLEKLRPYLTVTRTEGGARR